MGWPEFKKCCGCFSLTTGTVIIGCWTLIVSMVSLASHSLLLINAKGILKSESEETIYIIEFVLYSLAIFLNVLQGVLGVMLIGARKSAKFLGKLVYLMVVLCLLDLLVVLASVSADDHYQHYFSVFLIMFNAYFILIVRSNQLQLEERLTNPIDVRSRSNEHGRTTCHNNGLALPPPYEEAMRYGTVYRCVFAATLTPTEEVPNEDARDITPEQTVSVPPTRAQAVATASNTRNIKTASPKEPICAVYDVEQFSAVSNSQVVDRSHLHS